MSRWVIASRRQRTPDARRAAARRTEEAFKKLFDGSSRVRGINRGGDERDYFAAVFDADANETRLKKRFLPREDAILEPEILHGPSSALPRVLRVLGDGQPLINARVTLLASSHEGGAHGRGPDPLGAARASARAALIEPTSGYWSTRVPDISALDTVHLDPLPPGPFGWWHTAMGCTDRRGASPAVASGGRPVTAGSGDPMSASARDGREGRWDAGAADVSGSTSGAASGQGESIAVGVIDTGCGPHAALWHVIDHGAYVHGVYSADGRDSAQHGTHLCGLIGARACPDKPAGYVGLAPDAALHSVRVCAIGTTMANQIDIALALRRLMRVPVHLVTIGLSASEPSAIVADAIREGMEAGILCICPAGNTASRVRFPAALDDTAAVTAVGLSGWGPPHARVHDFEPHPDDRARFGTLEGVPVGLGRDERGGVGGGTHSGDASAVGVARADLGADAARGRAGALFVASFSCVAPTPVTCAGPGVGIISCVPGEDGTAYAEMSGTSMAAALVTGALASILSAKENYLTLPRTLERADFAHALLGVHCRSMGIDRRFQGRGVPCVIAR